MGKAAGLRTYSLVALGACLFALVSIFGVQVLPVPQGIDPTYFRHNYDASRIASQIVVGIGFLGAGLIILRCRCYGRDGACDSALSEAARAFPARKS